MCQQTGHAAALQLRSCRIFVKMASMQKLPSDTVRLITSSQVITSIISIVKELIENSLDAGSDNIDVKLENYGFDKIEVRDNGSGIKPADAPYMARKHFTSKISQHADLESLATYGFRGEALGSLCAVSSVAIVTKTSEDEFGHVYVLDHEGAIISSKPSHLGNGTTITSTQLFKTVPVRRQYYSSVKRRREEIKKVEDLMMSYGAICPSVRFSLSHNKSSIWQKNKVANYRTALINIWGSSVMSQMQHAQRLDDDGDGKIQIEGFLPRLTADSQSVSRASPDRCWIAVNGRPITFKEMEKVVKQAYCQAARQDTSSVRHLVMFLSITLPSHCVDVNLEPNKTKVMLQNKEAVMSVLSQLLEDIYTVTQPTSAVLTSVQRDVNIICNTEMEDLHRTAVAENTAFENSSPDLPPEKAVELRSKEESNLEDIPFRMPFIFEDRHDQNPTAVQESSRLPEACRAIPNLTSSHVTPDTLSSSRGPDAETGFQLNFSIFDEDFEFDGTIDSDVKKSETRAEESTSVEPNVSDHGSKEGSDWSTTLDCADSAQLVSRSLSLTDWSKGRGLADKDGRPLQPATLLIPKNANVEKLASNHDASNELSANQTAIKSSSSYQAELVCTPSALSHHNSSDTVRVPNNITLGSKSMTSPANQEAIQSPSANQKKRSPGKLSLEKKVGKGILFDLVGRSTVRRAQNPFAFFSKEVRPQVVERNPKADFSDILKTIEDKWEQLDEEERRKYEEMGRKDEERYNNQVKSAQKKLNADHERTSDDMPSKKKKKKLLSSNQGLIDKMLLSQQQRIVANQEAASETPAVPTVDVPFSLIGLERTISLEHKTSENTFEDQGFQLIGQLASHGVWLSRQGNQLRVFNQYRVEETLLYHRLMAKHVLPQQPVEVPIILSPGLLGGGDCWNILLGLSSQAIPPDPAIYFTDERLTANGFEIKQTIDSETQEIKLQVIAMTTLISYYGICDLKEILELINSNPRVTLAKCRPLKVANYLKGEAVRMARNLPSTMTSEDILHIIKRMKQLPSQCTTCLHNLPFEHPLGLVPQSQV